MAVGAWINSDLATNQAEIDSLVTQAINGYADMVIVGSETLYRGDVTEETLIGYINDVKGRLTAAGISIPVTTADLYGSLMGHPAVIDAVDVVVANFYPYWEGKSIDTSMARLHQTYLGLTEMACGKEVVVSETGWPSEGQQIGDAVPSPENAAFYFLNFVSWAEANNIEYFYFEAYDEPWKVKNEGLIGAHWGISADTQGTLKPGMEKVFQGETIGDNWSGPPGAPIRDFLSLPDEIHTNIETFLVAGVTAPCYVVKLNGTPMPPASVGTLGEFSHSVPLVAGQNTLELTVETSLGVEEETASKTVIFDPDFSTSEKRLLYVDAVPGGYNSPEVNGTIVIDLDGDTVLGLLPGLHVRGISPDGTEIYMHDNTVIDTGTHQPLRTLPFSYDIPGEGFLVSPTGTRLYSRNEVVDLQSNALLDPQARAITTGSSWSGAPIPGGPAITADGTTIYAGNAVARIDLDPTDLDGGTVTDTGVTGSFMSDIEVSPDGSRLLVSEYANTSARLDIYNTGDYTLEKTLSGLGDFAGEISFLDNETLVVGTAGNPSFRNGFLSLVDLNTLSVVQQERIPLADNVETSSENREVFVSTGAVDAVTGKRFGVDVWVWGQDGRLFQTETFSLGINGSISVTGRPAIDQIRDIVYKPALPRDFGDAPDPSYPTLAGSDGARHVIVSGFRLGALIDDETDGQPNAAATGDDSADLADDDGVVMSGRFTPGQVATFDVTVADPGGIGGFLDAWIDADRDGNFESVADEHFIQSVAVTHGLNQFNMQLPAEAEPGETYIRFRLSSTGGLTPTGLAPDGEIEDYVVTILPVNRPPVIDLDDDDSSGNTGADYATTYVLGDQPVAAADSDAKIFDIDDTVLSWMSVEVTNPQDGLAETMFADTTSTDITAISPDGQPWTLTLEGPDTLANYVQVLRTVTYLNDSDSPDTSVRTIEFSVYDGEDVSNLAVTSLSINHPPTALSVSVSPDSFSETAGSDAATGTVTRTGDTTSPVTVSLTSDDTSEATVPSAVEILAGETSATFPVGAVDDTDADGTQAVTITTAATGYDSSHAMVQVTDDDFAAHYDFGRSTSPVATGYTQVSEGTDYTAARGYGWQSGTINSRDRSTGSVLEQDLNFTHDGTYVVDVPNGRYAVDMILGDKGPYWHDQVGVYLEGALAGTASTDKGQIAKRSYEVDVTDGQLTLRLRDLGGNDPNVCIVGLDVVAAVPAVVDPSLLVSVSPNAFSEAAGSNAATGTVTRTGDTSSAVTVNLTSDAPSEATAPAMVTIAAGATSTTFPIDAVNDPDVDGTQTVTITAAATDYDSGNRTIQVTDDDLPPFEAHFDFGTSTSLLAAGYTRVYGGTLHSDGLGHGWLRAAAGLGARDRGTGNALERDLNFTPDGTFLVDVPNGRYAVDMILGDKGPYQHDQMGVYLEGDLVDTVFTSNGQIVNRNYEVDVTDGQLTLRLRNLGGTDPNACIEALDIALLELLD